MGVADGVGVAVGVGVMVGVAVGSSVPVGVGVGTTPPTHNGWTLYCALCKQDNSATSRLAKVQSIVSCSVSMRQTKIPSRSAAEIAIRPSALKATLFTEVLC